MGQVITTKKMESTDLKDLFISIINNKDFYRNNGFYSASSNHITYNTISSIFTYNKNTIVYNGKPVEDITRDYSAKYKSTPEQGDVIMNDSINIYFEDGSPNLSMHKSVIYKKSKSVACNLKDQKFLNRVFNSNLEWTTTEIENTEIESLKIIIEHGYFFQEISEAEYMSILETYKSNSLIFFEEFETKKLKDRVSISSK